jgi:NitT/TauT family transport system permease protein
MAVFIVKCELKDDSQGSGPGRCRPRFRTGAASLPTLEVDDEALEMFHSLQAKKHQIFWQLMLPSAMPIIMAGLKTAISLALIGAIVGEFISASEGMGILMQRFTFSLNMAASFAALLMLTLMGLLLFSAMELLDNRLIYWRHDARIAAVSRKKAARWQRALATAS